MAVPVRAELMARVDGLVRRSAAAWRRGMDSRRTELRAAERGLPDADELFAAPRQRLDVAGERLSRALSASVQMQRLRYARLAPRLAPEALRTHLNVERRHLDVASERLGNVMRLMRERRADRLGGLIERLGVAMRANVQTHRNAIARDRERVAALAQRAERAALTLIRHRASDVERLGQLLGAFSYRGVLARGFALVRDLSGAPLRSAAAVAPGLRFDVEFDDGKVRALAEGDARRRPPLNAPAARRRKPEDPDQGALF
jgi:exodeoxyribonuclease VII large subunit